MAKINTPQTMTTDSKFRRKSTTRSHKKGNETRAHILTAARECFNRQGISAVTCRTIAAHAGLSAGNVYYYFANKDVILEELRGQLDGEAKRLLDDIESQRLNTPEQRDLTIRRWMDLVWTWRFIFLDIHQFVRDHPHSRSDMLAMQHRSISLHKQLYQEHLVSRGLELTPADQKLCYDLAVSNWLISIHWLQYMCLEKGELGITKEDFDGSIYQSQTLGRIFYDDNLIKRLHEKTLT